MLDIRYFQNGFDCELSSELCSIDEIVCQMEFFLIKKSLQLIVFDIVLLVREALLNAIIHGNQYDREKKVVMKFRINEGCIRINITDQGNGFKLKQQCNVHDDILSNSGRGVAIMQTYSDSLTYNTKEKTLTIVKKLNGKASI